MKPTYGFQFLFIKRLSPYRYPAHAETVIHRCSVERHSIWIRFKRNFAILQYMKPLFASVQNIGNMISRYQARSPAAKIDSVHFLCRYGGIQTFDFMKECFPVALLQNLIKLHTYEMTVITFCFAEWDMNIKSDTHFE